MKKILLLSFVIAACFSCSKDDAPGSVFYFEVLPIESVTIPSQVEFGETYTIDYNYLRPSDCHFFSDLYYLVEGSTRTVAVVNSVLNSTEENCSSFTNEIVESSFDFYVTQEQGAYTFKFWQGENENGDDTYLVFEVPVVD